MGFDLEKGLSIMIRYQKAIYLGLLLSWLTSCKCQMDGNKTKLQYMPDMATAPVARAQREYLDPPPGSVPHNAILYPKTAEESETLLVNPFTGRWDEDIHREAGKRLFGIYCAVCHGLDLKGQGSIQDKFPTPPNLTLDLYKNRKDGYYAHVMTYGSPSGIMPGYGHALWLNERWEIVLYIRELQKVSDHEQK